MAEPVMPEKVCLVVGMLSARMELFGQAEEKLCARFGPVLRRSAVMPFDFTDYYTAEMGQKIHRQFLAFERPIAPNTLCEIKLWTNALEQQFVAPDSSAPRTINLDPGLLYLSRLILATTKDNAHRIYLDRGIYAEVTLIRRENTYQILPWTYPDYRTAAYRKFFEDVRTEIIQRRPTATSRPGGTCK